MERKRTRRYASPTLKLHQQSSCTIKLNSKWDQHTFVSRTVDDFNIVWSPRTKTVFAHNGSQQFEENVNHVKGNAFAALFPAKLTYCSLGEVQVGAGLASCPGS